MHSLVCKVAFMLMLKLAFGVILSLLVVCFSCCCACSKMFSDSEEEDFKKEPRKEQVQIFDTREEEKGRSQVPLLCHVLSYVTFFDDN